MNETIKKLRQKASDLEIELSDLYAMSEERACDYYNVDYKDEAIALINEDLVEVYEAIEKAEEMARAEEYKGWVDPAFRAQADFDRMRI